MFANPVSVSPTRTRADAMPDPPPQEDSDDVSVMNSKVESMMNHRRLKEAMRAPAFSEQEFTALSSVDAYLRAARDGLARAEDQHLKDVRVSLFYTDLINIYQ